MKQVKYIPFVGVEGYSLKYKNEAPYSLCHKNSKGAMNFELIIKPGGFIPKSGLFLSKSLEGYVINKSILEIGTGETGVISIFCSKAGAKKVTAVDIDGDAIKWARYNGEVNKTSNISLYKSDKFENVHGKYDFIVTNPPQMPMLSGSLHDSGGKNGRETIDLIITNAKQHLNKNGSFFLLVFDFLNVEKPYGDGITIFELLRQNGFEPHVIAETKREVRPGGETFKSLEYVKKIYPKYKFIEGENSRLFYKMLIVKADLV